MSAQKKVVTIKGEELPISQCKKFNKLYYKIGNPEIKNSGDCYFIEGKYYREETKLIVFNHSVNKYVNLNSELVEGVIDVLDDKLMFGHFNISNDYSKVKDKKGIWYVVFNADIFKNSNIYRERLSSGEFYHISKLPAIEFSKIVLPNSGYKTSLPYDSKGILDSYLKNYNENYNPEISDSIKRYAPLLEDLSFGLEFETTKGFVPNRILNKYGLIPLRDGSITGIEYVTVPMEGEKGLQATCDIVNTLKERTEFEDRTCSMHLHLGNLPRTKEFMLAFFKVGMFIQDEMFSMFPLYKKYNYNIKNKNYSAPLPTYEILSKLDRIIDSTNIDHNFGVIYEYLSMGQRFDSVGNNIDNIVTHPADPNGTQKWNIRPRYHIYNMIPLLFGNKQTIEFRIHTPTYEANKVIPFILMNALIVNYVKRHQDSILKNPNFLNNCQLSDILVSQIYKHKINNLDVFQDYIIEYIINRKYDNQKETFKGNILGTESKIRTPYGIDWSRNIKKSKSLEKLNNKLKNTNYKYSSFYTDNATRNSYLIPELKIMYSDPVIVPKDVPVPVPTQELMSNVTKSSNDNEDNWI